MPLAAHRGDSKVRVSRRSLIGGQVLEETPLVLREGGCGGIRHFKVESDSRGGVHTAKVPGVSSAEERTLKYKSPAAIKQ